MTEKEGRCQTTEVNVAGSSQFGGANSSALHETDVSMFDELCVRVRYRKHEATLVHNRKKEVILLKQTDRQGRIVNIVNISTWDVVNIETAEERALRLRRPFYVDMAQKNISITISKNAASSFLTSSSKNIKETNYWKYRGSSNSSSDSTFSYSFSSSDAKVKASEPLSGTSDLSKFMNCVYYLHYVEENVGLTTRISTVVFSSLPGSENHKEVEQVVQSLLRSVYSSGPKKLFLFVSPKSGAGNAVDITKQHVLPVLYFSRHEVYMLVTTHALHSEEYIANTANNIGDQDVIVCIGGDGMVHEAVNGLYRRRDVMLRSQFENEMTSKGPENTSSTQKGKSESNEEEEKEERGGAQVQNIDSKTIGFGSEFQHESSDYSHIGGIFSFPSIAVIPAGSGCGMAKTLNVSSIRKSVLALVHLHLCTKDLMSLRYMAGTNKESVMTSFPHRFIVDDGVEKKQNGELMKETEAERISFMSSSFGIINAIDRGSEKLRWMGNFRFTAYAAYTILRGVKAYSVRLRYLPWRGRGGQELQKLNKDGVLPTEKELPACTMTESCAHCLVNIDTNSTTPGNSASGADGTNTFSSPSALLSDTFFSTLERETVNFEDDSLPWVTLDRGQYSIFISNIRDATRTLMMTPFAHISDGSIDMMFIQAGDLSLTRANVINFFTKMETGDHVKLPFVSYVKARAIELEALEGFIMSDGEVMPFTKVRITPLRRGVAFVRGR